MKPRQHLYLNVELSEQLAQLASSLGATKSSVVADALKAHLKQKEAQGPEEDPRPRLESMSKQLRRIERSQFILVETLALYIRFHFSVVPPLPESDQSIARVLSQQRFQALINQVGRRLAGNRTTVDEVIESSGETAQ